MARGQSERLLPMARAAMAAAGLPWRELDAVAVTSGPGGFTGVRIGLAAAQGLALAWDLPVIAVGNFEATTAMVPPQERQGRHLVVLLDAKRAEVYVQVEAETGELVTGPALMGEAAVQAALPDGPLLLAGSAAGAWIDRLPSACLLSSAPAQVSAAAVAEIAGRRPPPRRPWQQPQPLYLREADTTGGVSR